MAMSRPTKDHEEIRRWAEKHGVVPVEDLPHVVDHVPSLIRLLHARQVHPHGDQRLISWEDFFAKFDALGLMCVYDQEPGGYNEILQVQGEASYGQKSVAGQAPEN